MLRSDIRRASARAVTLDGQRASERTEHVRALLAALTEIDHAYEADLETVRTSDAPIAIKQAVIDTLRQRHQERRAPYLQKLQALQTRGCSRPGGAS
jgi:hypothetical protein